MKYLIVLFLVPLFGCATNPYKEFYTDQTNGKELATLPVVVSSEEPHLVIGTDPDTQGMEMAENNYIMLGYSHFNGALSDKKDAVSLAKKLHAEVVIVYSKYSNTVSGVAPMMMPISQTSYSTANATAYGSNGSSAIAYGNGTTTTYGTAMGYMPYNVDRYDQGAQFWIRGKPRVFGANVKDLSEEKKKEINSNKGIELLLVVKEMPAFNSDFMRGDVIKRIDDREIGTEKDFFDALNSLAGKSVTIEFIRNGKTSQKTVKLNEATT